MCTIKCEISISHSPLRLQAQFNTTFNAKCSEFAPDMDLGTHACGRNSAMQLFSSLWAAHSGIWDSTVSVLPLLILLFLLYVQLKVFLFFCVLVGFGVFHKGLFCR